MELQIVPEPSPEERAAIVAALQRTAAFGADVPAAWGRPELEDEAATKPPGA